MVHSPYDIKKRLLTLGNQIRELKSRLTETINNEGTPEHPLLENENKTSIQSVENKIISELLPSKREKISIASIDSSSRYLRDPSVNLVIVGLGVYSNKFGIKVGPFDITTNFMSVSTFEDILKNMNCVPGIRVKNYVNEYFREDYKIDDIADELRLENENLGLKEVKDNHDLIIVDGPLYPTPLELSEFELQSEGRKRHQNAYLQLTKERVGSLNDKIVGVVKRLETSQKLYKEDKIRQLLKVKYPINDAEVLNQIRIKLCREGKCSSNLLVGPFKIEFSSQYFSSPSRYAYYLIVTNPIGMASYFRVESLSLDKLNEFIPYVTERISERLIPTYIEIVDNLSKRVSASLFVLAYEVLSSILSINHDDKLSYYNVQEEFSSSMFSLLHQRNL